MQTKLRKIRIKNKMTLKELGLRLGKSKQYMSELERGNIRLTYEMALKIAHVFEATPDDLFLLEESNDIGHTDTKDNRLPILDALGT